MASSDRPCNTQYNRPIFNAHIKYSQLDNSLFTAFYAANYVGLNEPSDGLHKTQ